jgi:hypothetical protein
MSNNAQHAQHVQLVHFYYIQGVLDLAKMRDEARRRSTKGNWRGVKDRCVIHHHKKSEPCEGHDHEYYDVH